MWMTKVLQIISVDSLICLGFLAGISVYDIFFRKISGFVLVIGTILAVGYSIGFSENSWYVSVAGAAIGGVLLVIAYATDQSVGYGDVWLLTILGIYLGIWTLLEVLMVAWMIMAIAAGICLIKKKWSRHTAPPMSPFITVGFIVLMASEYINR